jgi:hypothetical protein
MDAGVPHLGIMLLTLEQHSGPERKYKDWYVVVLLTWPVSLSLSSENTESH